MACALASNARSSDHVSSRLSRAPALQLGDRSPQLRVRKRPRGFCFHK